MYADVAVCLPLTRTFAYRLNEPVQIGCRVLVPFRKREVEGFVVGLRGEPPADIEVHSIGSIIDRTPLVRPEIFELCRWISEYYVSPPGEVLKSALPPGISAKHVERGLKPATTFENKTSGDKRDSENVVAGFSPRPVLTEDQIAGCTAIQSAHGFHTILLHGITGSGKTEIYMQAAEHFLAAGKTSLILVPEIGLTPQLTDRFTQRFPGLTAVLHSSLSKRQRIDEWLRIYCGKAPIVIGTRSAVFAPLQNLGLIVVDEEHESSYKQEEAPRYHARDVAVVRAKIERAVVLLGSATPSLESYHNTLTKKYELASLTQRVDHCQMPLIRVIDLRQEPRSERSPILSERLRSAISDRVAKREQTILFLNRRGFSTSLLCSNCGKARDCPNCSG